MNKADIKDGLKTTAMVLVVIWGVRRFNFGRNFVDAIFRS